MRFRRTTERRSDASIIEEPSQLDRTVSSLRLAVTQLADASRQRRLVKEWCALLPTLDEVTTLEFESRVNQGLFEAACGMPQLEHLRIKWSGIRNLDSIRDLHNLRSLRIGPSGSISSIDPIATLTNLTDLELEDFSQVSDFSALSRMPQLERLTIDGGMGRAQVINTLAPLSDLRRLRYLSLRNSRITHGAFDPILGLPELRELHSAWFYPLPEFEKLASMAALKKGNVTKLRQYRKHLPAT